MAKDKKTGIDRLEEEMEKQILETPKEELLEESRAQGRDPEKFAAHMRALVSKVKTEAGKARRAEARARLEQERKAGAANVVRMPIPEREQASMAYHPDTMAARHGNKLSERDKKAMEDDANELFNDNVWNNDQNDKD